MLSRVREAMRNLCPDTSLHISVFMGWWKIHVTFCLFWLYARFFMYLWYLIGRWKQHLSRVMSTLILFSIIDWYEISEKPMQLRHFSCHYAILIWFKFVSLLMTFFTAALQLKFPQLILRNGTCGLWAWPVKILKLIGLQMISLPKQVYNHQMPSS